MNSKLWWYCAIIFVYTAFLPIGFNFDNDEVVTIFQWGCAKNGFVTYELATGGIQIIYPVFAFFPMYYLLARWSSTYSARKKRIQITPFEIFLLLIEIGATVGSMYILKMVLTQIPGLFASPLFYIHIVNNALLLYQLIAPCSFWSYLLVPEDKDLPQ